MTENTEAAADALVRELWAYNDDPYDGNDPTSVVFRSRTSRIAEALDTARQQERKAAAETVRADCHKIEDAVPWYIVSETDLAAIERGAE